LKRSILSCAVTVVLLCAVRPGWAQEPPARSDDAGQERDWTLPPFSLNWKTTAGYIGAGVGVASLVTGVIFGGLAKGKQGELEESQGPCSVTEEIDDTGKTYENVQLAGIIIGVVLVSVGSHLVYWGVLSDEEKRAGGSRATIAPVVTHNGFGLAGVARF
jgi:hypothetical protein